MDADADAVVTDTPLLDVIVLLLLSIINCFCFWDADRVMTDVVVVVIVVVVDLEDKEDSWEGEKGDAGAWMTPLGDVSLVGDEADVRPGLRRLDAYCVGC